MPFNMQPDARMTEPARRFPIAGDIAALHSNALFGRDTHHGLRAIAGHLLVAHLGPHVAVLGPIIPGQGVMDQPCPAPYLNPMTMKPFITPRRALLATLALAGCAEARAPMGPVVTRPALRDDVLVMADGVRLPLHAWQPEGSPRAVMLALHGMNEYGRSFAEDAAPWFTGAGVALYAYDQRGFGGTAPRGVWPGHETLAQDAITAAVLIRARHPGLPLFMLGESMGGAVLVLAGSKAPIADGRVLSAPALRGRNSLGWPARWTLDVMVALTPGLALSSSAPLFRPTDNLEAWRRRSSDPKLLKQTRVDAVVGLVERVGCTVVEVDDVVVVFDLTGRDVVVEAVVYVVLGSGVGVGRSWRGVVAGLLVVVHTVEVAVSPLVGGVVVQVAVVAVGLKKVVVVRVGAGVVFSAAFVEVDGSTPAFPK